MMRCAAVLNVQYRCKIPMMQLCQQEATIIADGFPLCGTHVNHPPARVITDFGPEIKTVVRLKP